MAEAPLGAPRGDSPTAGAEAGGPEDRYRLFRRPRDVRSFALTGLFVLAVFYTLYFARAVFIPIALAILLKLVLAPLVRRLDRVGVPESIGAVVVIALALGTVVFGVVQLSVPATEWLSRAPQSFAMAEYKLRDVKRSVEEVREAAKKVAELTSMDEPEASAPAVVMQGPRLAESFFVGTYSFLVAAIITIVLLYFMLAAGDLFLRKMVQVLPRLHDKKRAIEIARQTERDISTFLLTVTCINTLLGCATGLAMWALGMPNPVLWGVLAGVLNFVPYLGPAVMIGVLALVSLLSFDSWSQMLLAPGGFLVLTTLEGQLITPLVLGQRLTLNPVVIFVALLVWGWLWNVPGVLLAVPLLATFKIVCDHVDALTPVGHFLGRRDE